MVDRAAMKVVIGNYTYQGEMYIICVREMVGETHIIPGNLLSKRLLPLITEQRKINNGNRLINYTQNFETKLSKHQSMSVKNNIYSD